jgi:4-amino-4-deoxy-L-arabinose transferase-like glycosyltransferase
VVIVFIRHFIEMKRKTFWIILGIVVIFGGFLRMVALDKNPPHLGNDEISIAYDSYSVRTTGKDEYGISWPLSFRSHRDYKPPLYAYLNMPFNLIFGNNEYGIRFLSALAGTLMILIIGIMGRRLGGDKLGLLAAFLLAINPKSIFVSRMSYESNLAALLVLLGVYLMYLFKEKGRKIYLLTSGLFLGFSIWAYHTEKGLVPLLITILPWWWRKKINLRRWTWLWLMVFVLIVPIFWDFVNVQMKDPYNRATSQIWYSGAGIQDYFKTTDDNVVKKTLKVAIDPVYRYIEHFNFDFLFTKGMELFPKNEPLNSGWFLITTLPLLIIGLANLKKFFGKNFSWILIWWGLCPIVPSLTYGDLAAVRNLPFISPTILIMAAGALTVWNKSKKWQIIMIVAIMINFIYFAVSYYVHFPKMASDNFQYGYKQAWLYIKPIVDEYDQIIVEPKFGLNGQFVGLPRLYFGYFGAFSSKEMLERDDKTGRIDKYWIRNVDWNDEILKPKSIYIVSVSNPIAGEATNKLKLMSTIRNTDGRGQFLIYSYLDN